MAAFDYLRIRDACLELPAATLNVQWHDDHVFKVGGKMFCVSADSQPAFAALKADPERFLELTDQPGITPSPYLARAKWIRIDAAETELPFSEIELLIQESYRLVCAGLTRKLRSDLGLA